MPCIKCKDGKYKYGNTGECKYNTKEECEKANPKKYNKMKQEPSPLGKKTYEEYAKELKEFNLSKVKKVELGLVDDLENSLESLEGITKDLQGDAQVFQTLRKRVQNDAANGEERVEQIKRYNSNLEKQAKDLGLNANDIPAYKKSKKIISNFESLIRGKAKLGGLLSL